MLSDGKHATWDMPHQCGTFLGVPVMWKSRLQLAAWRRDEKKEFTCLALHLSRACLSVCSPGCASQNLGHQGLEAQGGCRDELEEYDPFDEGVFCRSRFWLFISYIVSFASVVGAVWVLLGHYALNPDVSTVWPGIAGLFQVSLQLLTIP